MVIGGYELHLYCDACGRFQDFGAECQTFADARRQAEAWGWVFDSRKYRDTEKVWCRPCSVRDLPSIPGVP